MILYNLLLLASSSLTSDNAMRFLTDKSLVLKAIASHEIQATILWALRRRNQVNCFRLTAFCFSRSRGESEPLISTKENLLGFSIVTTTELGAISDPQKEKQRKRIKKIQHPREKAITWTGFFSFENWETVYVFALLLYWKQNPEIQMQGKGREASGFEKWDFSSQSHDSNMYWQTERKREWEVTLVLFGLSVNCEVLIKKENGKFLLLSLCGFNLKIQNQNRINISN